VTFNIESVSNTGFTSYGMYHDGSASQQTYYWQAVGEKA